LGHVHKQIAVVAARSPKDNEMNTVFPRVQTGPISEVVPGSLIKIQRSEGLLTSLVTSHVGKTGNRSFVTLNAKIVGRPRIFFAEDWSTPNCLSFANKLHFELNVFDGISVDGRGYKWEDEPGVILASKSKLFLRAAPENAFYGTFRYLDVETGDVLADVPPPYWSCGAWKISIRDELTCKSVCLFEFDITTANAN
jgi:hypothetical protein